MVQPLALPTFVTGPSDKLAAVDVYNTNQQVGQVVNSVQNILRQYDPQLARSLAGFNSLQIQDITRAALSNVQGGYAATSLLDRVMQINPDITSTIRSMDSAIREQFATTLSNVGNGIKGAVGDAKGAISDTLGAEYGKLGSGTFGLGDNSNFSLMCGDIESPIKTENIFQTTQMANMVNSIVGTDTIVLKDTGAQVGMYSAIIKESLNTEISGVTKSIFNTIADRQVLSIVAHEVLPDVVRYSSVNDLYNLSSNLYSGELLQATPTLLNIFSQTFGNSPNSRYHNSRYGSSQHVATYAELLRAYETTSPKWNQYTRETELGPEEAIDISILVGGTNSFNSTIQAGALNSNALIEKPYLLAPIADHDTVETQLAQQYPKTKFYFDNSVTKIKDPRSINM